MRKTVVSHRPTHTYFTQVKGGGGLHVVLGPKKWVVLTTKDNSKDAANNAHSLAVYGIKRRHGGRHHRGAVRVLVHFFHPVEDLPDALDDLRELVGVQVVQPLDQVAKVPGVAHFPAVGVVPVVGRAVLAVDVSAVDGIGHGEEDGMGAGFSGAGWVLARQTVRLWEHRHQAGHL